MKCGGAERQSLNGITEEIIGAAIELQRVQGPGLLESAYEECLCHELNLRKLAFRRQALMPVTYKSVKLDCGYVLDLVAEDQVDLELKSVESLQPVHAAQVLTYLRLLDKRVGPSLIFARQGLSMESSVSSIV